MSQVNFAYQPINDATPNHMGRKSTLNDKLHSLMLCCFCRNTSEASFRSALMTEDLTKVKQLWSKGGVSFDYDAIDELTSSQKFTSLEFLISKGRFLNEDQKTILNNVFNALKHKNSTAYIKILGIYLKYYDIRYGSNHDFIIDNLKKGLLVDRNSDNPYDSSRLSTPKVTALHLVRLIDLNFANLRSLFDEGFTVADIEMLIGICPLLHIIKTGKDDDAIKCINLLVDNGALIDVKKAKYKHPPLYLAVEMNKSDFVKALLKRHADPHLMGVPWDTFYDESGNCVFNVYNLCSPFQRALLLGHKELLAAFHPYIGEQFQDILSTKLASIEAQKKLREIKSQ